MSDKQQTPGLRLTEHEDQLLNLLFNAVYINGQVDSRTVNEQIPLAVFDLLNQAHCRDLVPLLQRIVQLETQAELLIQERLDISYFISDIENKMNEKHHTYTRFKDWFIQAREKVNSKIKSREEVEVSN